MELIDYDPPAKLGAGCRCRWWPYATVAAVLALTWILAGPLALAIASVTAVFLLVGFFVGALSESRVRGVLSGLAAAVPVALFFMWLLK